MINEEMTRQSITIKTKIAKLTAKAVIAALKTILKLASNSQKNLSDFIKDEYLSKAKPLREMVKKGELEAIDLPEGEMKELKKVLNKYRLDFSVMKDKETGLYTVFFQAKNAKVFEKAFKKAIENFEKKQEKKESTIENIKKNKEKSKNMFKDKVKNKQKEQSL